ncbi:hypothetical protein [Idiomarina abyssalis]|uniref:hypothetical protein n=1 Tax=Idiomarina abyssalis TaxID=86102 RepID=UPI003A93BE59
MTNSNDTQKLTRSEIQDKGVPVVFRSKKAGKEVEQDLTLLPYSSLLAVAQYGAQRFINDKLGGAEIDAKEAAEIFDRILKNLAEGWEGRQRSESVDPVEARARSLARNAVKRAIMQAGHKLKDVKKEQMAQLADDLYTKQAEAFKAEAAKLIEIEKAASNAGPEVDLTSLGL